MIVTRITLKNKRAYQFIIFHWLFAILPWSDWLTVNQSCDGYDCPVPEVGPCSNWEGMLWGYFADIVCGRFDKWPLGFCLHPEIDRTSSTLERRLWSVLQNTLCSSNQNVWCSLMLSEGRWKCSIRKLHVTENRSLILSNQDNWKLVSLRFF